LIKIEKGFKTLGEKQVLKDININVEKGSIFGLIGPNGAGKTTMIKCLMGIWKMDNGAVTIDNKPVFDNPEAKEMIGFVPDQSHYYNSYRVKEMIKFYTLAYKNFNMERYNKLNETFKIEESKYIRQLSKGMKTRLSLMLSLSIMPKVLILDEPTSGLDPIVKREAFNIILDDVAERGTTVFISSHNLGDIERICDAVAIIQEGEIKYQNTIEDMKKNIRKLQVVFKDENVDLSDIKDILSISKSGRVYYVVTKEYTNDIKDQLNAKGASFIEEIDLNLEDIFIHSVGRNDVYESITK
jgi:ABC-2 type transport system ATP-binding protein